VVWIFRLVILRAENKCVTELFQINWSCSEHRNAAMLTVPNVLQWPIFMSLPQSIEPYAKLSTSRQTMTWSSHSTPKHSLGPFSHTIQCCLTSEINNILVLKPKDSTPIIAYTVNWHNPELLPSTSTLHILSLCHNRHCYMRSTV